MAAAAKRRAVNAQAPRFVVERLTKRYLGLTAVDDLSYLIGAGEIVGLIGPNGSGKSTSIDCVSGFQRADAGRWSLDGVDLTGRAPHRIAAHGLVRTFQDVRAYDELSLIDNLCIARQAFDGVGWLAALKGGRAVRTAEQAARERARELLHEVGLDTHAQAPALALSYGQRKLLAIAASMMSTPRLVILDEPVAGVNPTMIRRIDAAIRILNAKGASVLLIEHNVDFVMSLCARVVVLEAGRKIAEGPPALIRSDERVLAAYLGAGASAQTQASVAAGRGRPR